MTVNLDRWVGVDEHNGIPSLERPDAPKSRHWDLEAIAAVERPHHLTVSADGTMAAFILDRDGSDVWVTPVAGGPMTRITTIREPVAYWEDDSPVWSPDGTSVAFTAEGSVWVVPVTGGKPRKVCEGWSPRWIDDDALVVSVERDGESRLARVGVDDPWPFGISPPGQNVSSPAVTSEGSKVLYVVHDREDRNRSDIWVADLASGETERLTGVEEMQDWSPSPSPDGSRVAFISERSGWREIHVVGPDGSDSTQLTSSLADFSYVAWHRDGERLAAARTREGRGELVVIDAQSGEVAVVASGGVWSSVGWAGESILAVHEAYDTPPRVVRADGEGIVTTLTGPPPASISVAPHRPYEEIRYRSFDDLEIHGFLFRPDSASSGKVPAVVYPHGGPTSAYTDGWDGHAQYFVDKGYAWLAINFRGSTTYGRDFERANHMTWGVDDTEDCLAAADYLAGLEWVDDTRIAIFGASYGSYMALASLARDPRHRFACGVAKYGDSDIATSWAQGDRGGREDIERMMGSPAEAREAYRDGSPLWEVSNIERPILIAHGERDVRVHPDQSRQLADELRRFGKTFEYVTYPTEGHGLLQAGPQVHFYRRLERFLDWYLM
ncbi:MAG: S9 family peptidase [Acidimicrobiia bacterium]